MKFKHLEMGIKQNMTSAKGNLSAFTMDILELMISIIGCYGMIILKRDKYNHGQIF